jgi:uncharacterized membrane protein YdbT with pleckstrin-like domain
MFDGLRTWLTDPDVSKYLLPEEGEVLRDEVHKHWAAYLRPLLEGVAAVFFLVVWAFSPVAVSWLPFVLFAVLAVHGCWLALSENIDRFVITNRRVFRIWGLLSRDRAEMPIVRILDITVHRPLLGRLLGYGHFVFESAAQEQGLRVIKFVGNPDARDRQIQQLVQRGAINR